MEIWLWAVIGMMAVIIIALLVKIHILQKAEEIETAFADGLITDMNTLKTEELFRYSVITAGENGKHGLTQKSELLFRLFFDHFNK